MMKTINNTVKIRLALLHFKLLCKLSRLIGKVYSFFLKRAEKVADCGLAIIND